VLEAAGLVVGLFVGLEFGEFGARGCLAPIIGAKSTLLGTKSTSSISSRPSKKGLKSIAVPIAVPVAVPIAVPVAVPMAVPVALPTALPAALPGARGAESAAAGNCAAVVESVAAGNCAAAAESAAAGNYAAAAESAAAGNYAAVGDYVIIGNDCVGRASILSSRALAGCVENLRAGSAHKVVEFNGL
jgi:hypothetical protein